MWIFFYFSWFSIKVLFYKKKNRSSYVPDVKQRVFREKFHFPPKQIFLKEISGLQFSRCRPVLLDSGPLIGKNPALTLKAQGVGAIGPTRIKKELNVILTSNQTVKFFRCLEVYVTKLINKLGLNYAKLSSNWNWDLL